ncbi:hypothetical protein E0H22_24370 [Rhodopseudomonas boonkerdii]|nr:hypothetical protein E0H22_24370 [Rhodopseudomonas boonkerdii]
MPRPNLISHRLNNMSPAIIVAEPLTPEAFAPYGEVLRPPDAIDRQHFAADLVNLRPDARLNLSIVRSPVIDLAIEVNELEHHPYSAQAFIPIDVDHYVVLVTLNSEDDLPELPRMKAFVATRHQGICYRPGIWHLGMTTIQRPGAFALLVYEDGTANDCLFCRIPAARLDISMAGVLS